MNFNHYFTNGEIENQLRTWVEAFPHLTELQQIGVSHEKRPIWLLTITNMKTGSPKEKPAIWIDGNIHATELAGATAVLYMAYHLLEGYSIDPRIERLLNTTTYFLIPRGNPDGAALAMSDHPRFLRSGVRPYPWEDKDEGLHIQDIDGDGRILQMRIPDPNGDWKISPLDTRLLTKRESDEQGEGPFFRLLAEGIYVAFGAFDDWMYDQLGAFAFTVELWDLPTEAGVKERKFVEWWRDHPHEDDVMILKWIEEHGLPDTYMPWKLFDHPQLGKIELGGWNTLYSWRNPPVEYLEPEIKRHFPWLLSLSEMLPRLTLYKLSSQSIGEDTYRINLVVENNGYLPSYTSNQANKRQVVRPVRVELELPEGVDIFTGKKHLELGHLEGRSNKQTLASIWGSSPTDNRARTEWVVKSPTEIPLKIKVLSERAGDLLLEVLLK